MRLYLIKRRYDKKFFVNINGHYMLHRPDVDGEYWSDKSQTFFRTPEGVAGNLRKLCSEPYWNTDAPPTTCRAVAENWRELGWRNFDGRKLRSYEVVIMDIDILSMRATPAADFIQIDAIKSRPLNRRERAAVTD